MTPHTAIHPPRSIDEYRFADFRLHPRTRELYRGGERLHVEPKVFRLITFLIERRDRVVRHAELFANVWQGETVCHAALTQCVAQARRVLGDTAQESRFIRTLHRRGYRFVAPVTEEPLQSSPHPLPTMTDGMLLASSA